VSCEAGGGCRQSPIIPWPPPTTQLQHVDLTRTKVISRLSSDVSEIRSRSGFRAGLGALLGQGHQGRFRQHQCQGQKHREQACLPRGVPAAALPGAGRQFLRMEENRGGQAALRDRDQGPRNSTKEKGRQRQRHGFTGWQSGQHRQKATGTAKKSPARAGLPAGYSSR
jgi:hypothetical protein